MKILRCVGLTAAFSAVSIPVMAQTLSGPESIEFHARQHRYLISNTSGGNILARDADGILSSFTADPTSPYGIELLAGTLFVLDSGRVKGYDIDSAALVMNAPVTGASFLNGITSNGVDTLYFTDYSARTVRSLNVADLSAPVHDSSISTGSSTPNGIVFDHKANRLLIATWGSSAKILSLELTPGATPSPLINTTLGNIDGIALDCNGSIHVAAWSGCGATGGCIRRFDPPFTLTSTANVVANGLSSPADIDYNRVNGDIAVPESGGNRLSFHATGCPAALFTDDFER
jgi:sugar lactone lactonase YvrE